MFRLSFKANEAKNGEIHTLFACYESVEDRNSRLPPVAVVDKLGNEVQQGRFEDGSPRKNRYILNDGTVLDTNDKNAPW